MNHIVDDHGRTILAVGAPGSKERLSAQYPKLSNRLGTLYRRTTGPVHEAIGDAVALIRKHGVTSQLEIRGLLELSAFGADMLADDQIRSAIQLYTQESWGYAPQLAGHVS